MKKNYIFLFFIAIGSIFFTSCDLISNSPNYIYFWSLVDDYYELNDGITDPELRLAISVDYNAKTYFVMTRGQNSEEEDATPGYPSEAAANLYLNSTVFTLEEDFDDLSFDNSSYTIEVRELTPGDFHIFQIFDVSDIIKNKEYSIVGVTSDSTEGLIAMDHIKVIFK
ncbi:MAG: hypothetical protein ACPKNR_13380 [Pleomorphochaeta sp.]